MRTEGAQIHRATTTILVRRTQKNRRSTNNGNVFISTGKKMANVSQKSNRDSSGKSQKVKTIKYYVLVRFQTGT